MKKLRVLLVDDEIMIREGFKRLFDWEAHDCQVVGEAADGMEALARIDSLLPDIVIMDINIPIMSGLKVIQVSRIKHPDMAFVIVSGYDDFSYCREALRLKITDYILKPVNYEEFGTCIDNLKIGLFQRQVEKDPSPQDGQPIYENPEIKAAIGYIPDDIFYYPSATLEDMRRFYRGIYPQFDDALFDRLYDVFRLPKKGQIRRFSKGMQKQAAFHLALCTRTLSQHGSSIRERWFYSRKIPQNAYPR